MEIAHEAMEKGNHPFGALLADGDGIPEEIIETLPLVEKLPVEAVDLVSRIVGIPDSALGETNLLSGVEEGDAAGGEDGDRDHLDAAEELRIALLRTAALELVVEGVVVVAFDVVEGLSRVLEHRGEGEGDGRAQKDVLEAVSIVRVAREIALHAKLRLSGLSLDDVPESVVEEGRKRHLA